MTDSSYPVRRRGEKRRLEPNRPAIEWLERDLDRNCQIIDAEGRLASGLRYTTTWGRLSKRHSRPMFEVLTPSAQPGWSTPGVACPCGDMARNRDCPGHPDASPYTPPSDLLDYRLMLDREAARNRPIFSNVRWA
jgi:hypothetical protein